MDDKLDAVINEYEKVTGKSANSEPSFDTTGKGVDMRLLYIPVGVLLVLLVFHPKFLYTKENEILKFSVVKLLTYTAIFSACIITIYTLNKARMFSGIFTG